MLDHREFVQAHEMLGVDMSRWLEYGDELKVNIAVRIFTMIVTPVVNTHRAGPRALAS